MLRPPRQAVVCCIRAQMRELQVEWRLPASACCGMQARSQPSSQTDRSDEALRQQYPDGVVFVRWGPAHNASSVSTEHADDKNAQAARWLAKLEQPGTGLADLLGCASVVTADSDNANVRMHLCSAKEQACYRACEIPAARVHSCTHSCALVLC